MLSTKNCLGMSYKQWRTSGVNLDGPSVVTAYNFKVFQQKRTVVRQSDLRSGKCESVYHSIGLDA